MELNGFYTVKSGDILKCDAQILILATNPDPKHEARGTVLNQVYDIIPALKDKREEHGKLTAKGRNPRLVTVPKRDDGRKRQNLTDLEGVVLVLPVTNTETALGSADPRMKRKVEEAYIEMFVDVFRMILRFNEQLMTTPAKENDDKGRTNPKSRKRKKIERVAFPLIGVRQLHFSPDDAKMYIGHAVQKFLKEVEEQGKRDYLFTCELIIKSPRKELRKQQKVSEFIRLFPNGKVPSQMTEFELYEYLNHPDPDEREYHKQLFEEFCSACGERESIIAKMSLPEIIRRLLDRSGHTVAELAAFAGVDGSNFNKFLNSSRTNRDGAATGQQKTMGKYSLARVCFVLSNDIEQFANLLTIGGYPLDINKEKDRTIYSLVYDYYNGQAGFDRKEVIEELKTISESDQKPEESKRPAEREL
ncbi:MAG: hypothetical protein J6Y10_10400 [Lachnospiraceae bacterium]|nr:hypothetical protein [Lachnospiraceae bacterium]